MVRRLLLVEDDKASLEVASSFLRRRRYDVVAHANVLDAMRALEEDPNIGLVVTDLRMPGLDGFDMIRGTAELSRRTGRTLPVIVWSGHSTPTDEQQVLSLGAKSFLRKPVDLRQLLAEIDRNLDAPPAVTPEVIGLTSEKS